MDTIKNLIVTVKSELDKKIVKSIGCDVVENSSSSVIVRCNEEQYNLLKKTHFRTKELI